MLQNDSPRSARASLWAIGTLALLSVSALILTIWTLADFSREQEIIRDLTPHLPPGDMAEVQELAGELRLQWRLSALMILNIVASAVALTLVAKAYLTSERSLRDARVLASNILASVDQGIVTTNLDGIILSINSRGQALLGFSEPGTGIALKDLPPDHSPLNEISQQVLESQECVRDRDYVAKNESHERQLRAGCSLLQDHRKTPLGTVIHVRDVTEKTLMEQRLRRMERYMGLGSLAAGLQHEIKNPLSALALHVQLLQEALNESNGTSPGILEMLDVLKLETRRITGVLEGFRDFASVARLNRTEVQMTEQIQNLVRLVEPQAEQSGVHIRTELPNGNSAAVKIDAVRIDQVLLNLVVNAIAAMPDGGDLMIRLTESATTIEIEIADTGCGIPEDLRDKVFDPYFTTRSTGTGMGLALSEKIVRQHNGQIDFQTGSEGTVFTLSLPRNEAS